MCKKFDLFFEDNSFTDLNPLFVGAEQCAPGYSYGPRMRDYTIIHYILNGKGTVECNGSVRTAEKGQFFVIFENQLATYTANSKTPWAYFWIAFDGIYANSLRTLENSVADAPTDLFENFYNKCKTNSCDKYTATSFLYLLYSKLISTNQTTVNHDYPEAVKKIIKLKYMQISNVSEIAKTLNIDKRYMSRIFKERYGKTVIGYLIEVRIKHACELLKNGYSVSVAASIVGYSDSFNFSKMFTKIIGCSPREYKNEHFLHIKNDN